MNKIEVKEEEEALENPSGNVAPPQEHGVTAGPSGSQPNVAELVPKLEAVNLTPPPKPAVDRNIQPTEGHMGGVQGKRQNSNVQGHEAPMWEFPSFKEFYRTLQEAQQKQRLAESQLEPTEGHVGGVQGMGQNPNVQGQGHEALMTDGGQPLTHSQGFEKWLQQQRRLVDQQQRLLDQPVNLSAAARPPSPVELSELLEKFDADVPQKKSPLEPNEGDKGGKQGIGRNPNVQGQGRGAPMTAGGQPLPNYQRSQPKLAQQQYVHHHYHQGYATPIEIPRLLHMLDADPLQNKSQLEMQSERNQERQKIQDWLRKNRFHKFLGATFWNYTWSDMMETSKEDYMQICGASEGIRLYNGLHKTRTNPY